MPKRFLIIDDDPQNNLLSRMALKKSLGDVIVEDFINPELGLDYIQSKFSNDIHVGKTILLLDLNMPSMNGWEFLDEFALLHPGIKDKFCIYILSSSVDPRDLEKAHNNPLVMDFIEKPLRQSIVLELFG